MMILTDIEGTTSSIHFVKNVLFPYAERNMRNFIEKHFADAEVHNALSEVAMEVGCQVEDLESLDTNLQIWMQQDMKKTPLKALQGMLWREGYESGAYRAHMYPDALEALKRWRDSRVPVAVYSSGSVQAQQLFFQYSEYGDIRPLFCAHFDTAIGAKNNSNSYRKIAEHLGVAPAELVFLSDAQAELDAAAVAGCRTLWVQRPEDMAQGAKAAALESHTQVGDFEEVVNLLNSEGVCSA